MRQQAEVLTLIQADMQCKGERRRGRDGRRWEEIHDFKLTPLWIFPNTVYYNTSTLNTVCEIKIKRRNPKEVMLSFGYELWEEAAH